MSLLLAEGKVLLVTPFCTDSVWRGDLVRARASHRKLRSGILL
jgi:hypothetical protein